MRKGSLSAAASEKYQTCLRSRLSLFHIVKLMRVAGVEIHVLVPQLNLRFHFYYLCHAIEVHISFKSVCTTFPRMLVIYFD